MTQNTKDTWIILGASSSMARAFIRRLSEDGHAFILAGRDTEDLKHIGADCKARGASAVTSFAIDARTPQSFAPVIAHASAEEGQLSCAVFLGSMPDQSEIDADPSLIEGVIADSFTGAAIFLQTLAPLMEARGGGTIVGVGSVAGDRGRLGNYVYGAAKAGFATYLSGLRNRLARSGVHVMTVKPGPVDTAMTWGLAKQPFMTTPEAVAEDILKGLTQKRNVLYTAGIWRLVMLVIRTIPEPVFKKMSI